jgi:hypothetical protein
MANVDLGDFTVQVGGDDDEEQRRRDEEARAAAREALDTIAQMPTTTARDAIEHREAQPMTERPGGDEEFASIDAANRAETERGAPPRGQAMPSGVIAVAGRPVVAPDRSTPPPERSQAPAVASRRSPTFAAPMVDPAIVADAEEAPARAALRQRGAEADEQAVARRETLARKPEMQAPGRMDEGLPSEGQIGDARARDVMRTIAAALGNAFAGYSGRGGMVRPRREVDELTQQRQQGIQRRETQKAETLERDAQRADRQAQRDQEQTFAQQRLTEQARERDAALDIQRQRFALDERRVGAELAETERTRAQDAALDDAASGPTRQARAALAVRLSQLHPAQQASALEAIGGTAGLERMTGRQAMQVMEQLARPLQMRGTGGAGSGGSPGARGRVPTEQDRTALVDAAVRLGIPREAAELTSTRDLLAQVRSESAQRGRSEVAAERREEPDTQELLPNVRVSSQYMDSTTFRNHRQGIIASRHAGDSLRSIREVQQRYGVQAVIDPRARAELAAPLQRMLTRISQMRSSGVIQPSELPTIEAFLPDPSSGRQITIGEFDARMRSFMRDIEDEVRSTLEADGADAQSIENALRYVRGQYRAPREQAARPQERSAAPQRSAEVPREARRDEAGNVVMYGPQGARRVPPDRVAARQAEGWTFTQGSAR